MTNFQSRAIDLASFIVVMCLGLTSTHAEFIKLKTGELMEVTIVSMDLNTIKIMDRDQKSRTLQRADVAHIDFSILNPAPKAMGDDQPKNLLENTTTIETKFGTPAATFQTWRQAAVKGDIDSMASCYVSYRQKDVKNDLKKLAKDDFNKMRAATVQTDFTPAEPLYQGDRASLEINWRLGLKGDSQVLQFALEKDDWKIIQ